MKGWNDAVYGIAPEEYSKRVESKKNLIMSLQVFEFR
jgi:hypothetical protein